MHCAAGWATSICHAESADALMVAKIMSAFPHSTLYPCWKRKGAISPIPIFRAAIQKMLRNLERPMPVEYWRIQSASSADSRLWDGGCRESESGDDDPRHITFQEQP